MSAAAGASGDSQVASKLGLTAGQVVQELGWDDDVDDDLRVAIEDTIEGELVEEAVEAVDVVLLWWREEDGDLSRLATKQNLGFEVETIEGGYLVKFSADGALAGQAQAAVAPVLSGMGAGGSGYAVFIGKDHVGEGDPTLGRNLMKMAIYTLVESDDVPSSVLFMNSGVKLVAGEEPQVVESCNKLIERGCEILVCGTCLNFYGITDKLEVGEVSNMYDILSRMQEAGKVITL